LKKFLLILFVALAIFTGCRKDIGTNVNITNADLSNVNGQLQGSWVFPVNTLTIVDSAGKTVAPGKNQPASAFEFEGSSKVTVRPDPQTAIVGKYTLTTSKGNIFVNIAYPDGTKEVYQVVLLNAQSLTLQKNDPYVFYDGSKLIPSIAMSSTALRKTDVTGNFMNVLVKNDSIYSVQVFVTHQRGVVGDTAILVGSKSNITGTYTLNLIAQSGDILKVDIVGIISNASINAYFRGVPLSGQIYATNDEVQTSTGWTVQF
jgi:hypothetical protein